MTSLLNRRSAHSLARWALGMRLVSALTLDGAPLGHAGWIALLLSALLAFPLVLLLCLVGKSDPAAKPLDLVDSALGVPTRRVLCLMLCAFMLHELGVGVRIGVLSAQIVLFEQTPADLLALIAILVCVLACLCGGRGMAGASRIFRGLFYIGMATLIIAQVSAFNWRWLTPILGPGWQPILRASLSLAGVWAGILPLWMCTSGESGVDRMGGADYKTTGPFYMLALLGRVLLGACVIVAFHYLLSPVLPGAPNERDFALELLLSDGLNAISLHFLILLIWFMAQVLQMSYCLFVAAVLLQSTFPAWRGWICVAIAGAAGYAVALGKPSDRSMIDTINALARLPLAAAITLLICVANGLRQRRDRLAKA